jgi:hypothetical protein
VDAREGDAGVDAEGDTGVDAGVDAGGLGMIGRFRPGSKDASTSKARWRIWSCTTE